LSETDHPVLKYGGESTVTTHRLGRLAVSFDNTEEAQ
jgi:hypothetical protein